MNNSNISIAWETLFGEEYKKILDPNDPANSARMNSEMLQEAKDLKQFSEGTGRVLFTQWKKDIQEGILRSLSSPDLDKCSCSICNELKELRYILHLIIKSSRLITEYNNKTKGD